ncbi:MAG TPA: UDP-N-acetylglucosamine 2-epimerase (non-hydrolyzing) [Solirubrobacteraceae bacterium]|jgi:UDP-N-acetylglucosamine 2-epimerase (non-hydrolysing)|nr:UDP-N-acetylglucosamine 2-epimerase (non-hydrolyzing) [Solirubrobacteraceae bacterium]
MITTGMAGRHKILSVVGTRPNFMKVAPIIGALRRREDRFEHVLVHTGQHYDAAMSEIFLSELGVGEPEHRLDVGSGTHAQQTARVMQRLEPVLLAERPDMVLVPGDVNSTLAAALVAVKLGLTVSHVEAGLRSFDRTMPEEVNRVVTDAISQILFIHSPEARDHLLAEGRDAGQIHYVGNTMIDTLVAMRERIEALDAPARHGLAAGDYVLVTLHRPALVDGPLLCVAAEALRALADRVPVVFPVHPRTRARLLQEDPSLAGAPGLALLEPVGYLEFLALIERSAGVLTDSGGIQEETTFLGIPCLTLRDNTERPITESMGTNLLLGLAPERIREAPELLAQVRARPHRVPPLWDGHAAERMVDVLDSWRRGAEPASALAASAQPHAASSSSAAI